MSILIPFYRSLDFRRPMSDRDQLMDTLVWDTIRVLTVPLELPLYVGMPRELRGYDIPYSHHYEEDSEYATKNSRNCPNKYPHSTPQICAQRAC